MKRWLLMFVATTALAGPMIPDDSIYLLESSWTDQAGQELKLRDLAGKPVLLGMFYTSCEYSCPLIVEDIKRVEARVSRKTHDWQVVLVSLDPLTDTPAKLREFAAKRGIPGTGWRLLTAADVDDVRELSALIGTHYKRAGREIAHSNLMVVLDARGTIAFSKPRLKQQIDETASTIVNLAR